ncbi:6-phospho-3-hexuloisomerase [Microbacterium ureisolvens]|uniref:SIS domain-containing protein n=1 Tax=Microbacterium ureisolvens TaxID=2781186 RepID=A0ABS7I1K6_9MICO|nr:6-phospho-3-hexuloisomerase [Microbacterium ureisolvens]MBW9111443.1 SIS domain-containing protein [Microbacterium ureisolvens]
MPSTTAIAAISPSAAISLVANEALRAAERAAVASSEQLDALADLLGSADRVFVGAAGRSGIALRMTAMRLMHLGLDVHVIGDVTTPAIGVGDVLLTASGSGTTESVVRTAQKAAAAGAGVAAITTVAASALADITDVLVVVPAAQKLDRTAAASDQYAGSLFEQVVVLLGDGLFHALWQRQGSSADDLWPRHSNLE